jgi:hypothetical protein
VRKSVANHLNDIAKDHPERVVQWVKPRLRGGASPERLALLKHASRGLIKDGYAPMLALWGAGKAFEGLVRLKVAPRKVAVGDSLTLSLHIDSAAKQKLLIDYAVHHVKANGERTPKVFKGWTVTPGAGEHLGLSKQHSLKPVTTRRYHAGRHAIEIRINGQKVASAEFDLAL